ncbi:hypothetical protein OIV83_002075 [Microbotryomycetes sp. JL201]|nr:hypothetical protein OIV83_002075 [Microbotryomycetes sp. JL201]
MVYTSLVALASIIGTVAALDNAQIASVFGTQATNLTAAKRTTPKFEFTVVTNATHALVSLNSSTAPAQVGWMATGTGTQMVQLSLFQSSDNIDHATDPMLISSTQGNADFLITWPNAGGNSPWTLSHRRPGAGGEVMPFPAAMPNSAQGTTNYYTLLPELSSTSSSPYTAVTYLRRLEYDSSYPNTVQYNKIERGEQSFIYASSSVSPGDADEAAQIMQHDQSKGTFKLDLSQPLQLAASGSPSGSTTASGSNPSASAGSDNSNSVPTSGGTGRTKRDMYIIAHAVLGSLALMLMTPLAIMIARFLRGSAWYPFHAGLNMLAAAMVIASFGIGVYVTGDNHFEDTHQIVGLVLFILFVLQVIGGIVAHNRKFIVNPHAKLPTLSNKGPVRYGHIVLGLAVVALGWFQVHEGFEEWEEKSDAQSSVPRAVVIVFWVLVGLFAALYVAGWILEVLGGNRPRGQQEVREKNEAY